MCKVECILNSCIHAKSTTRRESMCWITSQEYSWVHFAILHTVTHCAFHDPRICTYNLKINIAFTNFRQEIRRKKRLNHKLVALLHCKFCFEILNLRVVWYLQHKFTFSNIMAHQDTDQVLIVQEVKHAMLLVFKHHLSNHWGLEVYVYKVLKA